MNDDPMLVRLHELLDRGVDPFDDGELVAWLEVHPEFLPLAAALRADARDLAARVPAARSPGWRRPRLVLATCLATSAAAVALAVGTWPGPTPADGAQPRIVAASIEELRPRAHLAATFVVHDSLVTTGSARLESYTMRSERR
jgi:hypothetical protein